MVRLVLTGIHILLTYACLYECDHCFLHCGPDAGGSFTLDQLRRVFREIPKIGSIETVYFEGGEPFLLYPLLLKGLRMARRLGLAAGVVTNGWWATSVQDAILWLRPLKALGVADLSVSDDAFHESTAEDSPPKLALAAARKLGIPCDAISIQPPVVCSGSGRKGRPVIGGDVCFRGRAAEELTAGLPVRPARELAACREEDLENPSRVHLDSYGHVHLCQGLSMGNMWQTPLSELVGNYDPRKHPICGPLLAGGPAELARRHGIEPGDCVDECHCCYTARKALLERYPEYLAPRQVYGPG